MTRYRITLEYDGAGFAGWQRQANAPSVQQAIEDALAKLAGAPVTVHGAGRTDAGVHALAQVAHFDLDRELPPETVRNAINFHVRPAPLAVLDAAVAPAGFDARRSAVARAYLYRILNRRPPTALRRGRVWHVSRPLDAAAMHEAAQALVGRHDFSSFRAALCQARSPVKTLAAISVGRADDEIHLRLRARSFLHNQVRIITGTLRLVGEGRWSGADVARALAARDRAAAGPTAPAEGLYLVGVSYEGGA